MHQRPYKRRGKSAVATENVGASHEDQLLEIDRLKADLVQLRRTIRLKDDQLSMAVHELGTPLTSLKAYAEALLDHCDDPTFDRAREFLEVIHREAARLSRIVDRTLHEARARAEEDALRLSRFDILELSAAVSAAMAPILEDRAVQLTIEAPEKTPEVVADRDLVEQLLINLVHNAAKFSSPGDTIGVRAECNAGQLNLEVHDEGAGIAPEDLGKIFDPYFRARHVDCPDVGGSGLGLAIVKSIVERHGGTIRVESVVDEGTSFFIHLPQV